MSKYLDALKVLLLFVFWGAVIGFVFRFIAKQYFSAQLIPTVLMPAFGLQATLIMVFLSRKYHFSFYLNREAFTLTQVRRGLLYSLVFLTPILAAVIANSRGDFRIELAPLTLEKNRLIFFLAGAYSEELIFRGLLLGMFLPLIGVQRAIILQAILFSFAHWPQDSDLLLLWWRIGMGCFYGYIAHKSNSLLPGFMVHVAWNFCLLVFSALSSGISGFYGASVLGVFIISSQVPREVNIIASMFGCLAVVVLNEFLQRKYIR